MNVVILKGRLTKDPEIRGNETKIARYSLAVDRKEGADFIPCVCFGKTADFAERYLSKGTAILINGKLHTDNYTNKDGKKVFTMEVIVNSHEFCERKQKEEPKDEDGFMQIPEGMTDEELPFN